MTAPMSQAKRTLALLAAYRYADGSRYIVAIGLVAFGLLLIHLSLGFLLATDSAGTTLRSPWSLGRADHGADYCLEV